MLLTTWSNFSRLCPTRNLCASYFEEQSSDYNFKVIGDLRFQGRPPIVTLLCSGSAAPMPRPACDEDFGTPSACREKPDDSQTGRAADESVRPARKARASGGLQILTTRNRT